jgi:hypothetical protein
VWREKFLPEQSAAEAAEAAELEPLAAREQARTLPELPLKAAQA